MRIIAGFAKGTRLYTAEGLNTRPTPDRVREALFNIISERLHNARVLDLFAGSGAIGLEAISRGALMAVLADKSREAAGIIRKNIEKTRTRDKARFLNMEAAKAIELCELEGTRFDIVYIDPPYDSGLAAEALSAIKNRGILAGDALIITEGRTGSGIADAARALFYSVEQVRRYGGTELTFITKLQQT